MSQAGCPKSDKPPDDNVRNKATVKASYTSVPALALQIKTLVQSGRAGV